MKHFIAILLSIISAVAVAEITVHEYDTGETFILVEGEILEGDEVKFKKLVIRHNPGIIHLDSIGGDAISAKLMGEIIRERGIDTAISANDYCSSACVDVFLGGVVRYLEESRDDNSRLGFHASYLESSLIEAGETESYVLEVGQWWFAEDANYTVSMLSTLTQAREYLIYMEENLGRADASEMDYPYLSRLEKMGIVTDTY